MMELLIESASSFAKDIDLIIFIVAIIGGFWFIAGEGVLFYLIFRFSKKNNPKAAYISGEKHHEKKWIHRAHRLLLLCDIVIIFFAIKAWHHVKQELPPAGQTVRIIGQQWAWSFVQPGMDNELGTPDDITTVDDLHVKVNTVYHFKLESKDVLHSFSVPVFRLKQDAVPGRVITGWFEPTKVGEFDIQCAEMCGIGHGIMAARIHVHSEEDYQQWLLQNSANQANAALLDREEGLAKNNR